MLLGLFGSYYICYLQTLQSCFNWSTRSLSGEHAVPTRGLVSTLAQIEAHLSLFPANAHAWLPDIKTLVLSPAVDAIMAVNANNLYSMTFQLESNMKALFEDFIA